MFKYRFLPSSGSRVVSFLVFSCCFLGYLHSSVPHCPDSHLIWQDSFTEDGRMQSVTVPILCMFYQIFLERMCLYLCTTCSVFSQGFCHGKSVGSVGVVSCRQRWVEYPKTAKVKVLIEIFTKVTVWIVTWVRVKKYWLKKTTQVVSY